MSPTSRALLGAALGALLTLFAHPASRPFMTGIASRTSPTELRDCVDANADSLHPPTTLADASLWMQLACERIVDHDRFSQKEWSTLLAIAQAAEAKERTNAFWPQMQAILYQDVDQPAGIIDAWTRASSCAGWNDYQVRRLLQARGKISDVTGVRQSWQLAYLYFAKSDAFAYCLRSVARNILSRADYDSARGLELRYLTLLNGDLVRARAHSNKTSIVAMEIVELASYPSDRLELSPKLQYYVADKVETNLVNILHQPDWAKRAKVIFREAEAYRALTVHKDDVQVTDAQSMGTILCSAVAGAAIIVSLTGLMIWGIGKLVAWRLSRATEIKPVVAVIVAIVLGAIADVLTGYLPAALAVALCAAFLTVAPDRTRKARPSDLGPLFTFMSMVIGLLCSAMFLAYLMGTTPAANAVLPSLGVPSDYFDKPLMAGLAAVSFGLVLLMAPIWAVVHRLGTPHVLALTLMRFGGFVSLLGLVLSVALGPLSVYADQRLETTFLQLVTKEPIHHYVNQ